MSDKVTRRAYAVQRAIAANPTLAPVSVDWCLDRVREYQGPIVGHALATMRGGDRNSRAREAEIQRRVVGEVLKVARRKV